MTNGTASFTPVQGRAAQVGRDEELQILDEIFAEVRAGETRIVTLFGPAGIGKSRLIDDFVARQRHAGSQGSAAPVKVFRGNSRDRSNSYGLFARLLRSRFGLVEGMDPEAAKQQVRQQCANVLDDRKVGDVIYYLGQFLDLDFPESPLTRAVLHDAQQGELVRRAVFKAFLEADAAHSPTLLVFDDLHHAHEDSLALLRYLLEYLSGPILLLCAGRDELKHRYEDWDRIAEERHTVLDLVALDDEDATEVMRALLKPCKVPVQQLIDAAVAFAGGNPMMLEQMVRIYHDVGVLSEADALAAEPEWAVNLDKLSSAKLPITIDDAVAARVTALDPQERRLLEHASVMGSVFWRACFVALSRTDEEPPDFWRVNEQEDVERIDEILADLVERDYILRLPDSTFSGTDEYIFKHNKERLEIQRRMSAATTRRYHQVVADWLEYQSGVDQNEEYAAMLAEHREAAGDHHQAGITFVRAGDIARSRYANLMASEYYERGLSMLDEAAIALRINTFHNYGDVLQLIGRVDDALAAFEEMRTLAFRLDLEGKGGAAHNRIGRLYREIGSLDDAEEHLQVALALFRSANDERGVASTIDDIGKIYWLRGEYDGALEEMREGLARREKLGDPRSIALSLNNLGVVLQDSGDFSGALVYFDKALAIRREIGDLIGVVASLNNLGSVSRDLRAFDDALKLFHEALEVANDIGDRNRLALILTNIGETHDANGQPNKAIDVLRQAQELCDELGDKLGLAEVLRALGKAFMLQGDLVRARDCIGRAVDLFASVRSKVHLGSALRTLGEITAAGGWGAAHTKSAREYYARSVAIFEQTGNEIELARTYKLYARFLRNEPEFVEDDGAQEEAADMDVRADEIFKRLQVSVADRSGAHPAVP